MSFVQREINRIQETLTTGTDMPEYDRLYAAQQALLWVLEPNGVNPLRLYYGHSGKLRRLFGCMPSASVLRYL